MYHLPTRSNPSILPTINELLRRMSEDEQLRTAVRVHRLDLEMAHLRLQKKRVTDILHISEASFGTKESTACERRLAYKLSSAAVSNPAPLHLVNVYEVGHDAHSKYQGFLSWMFPDAFRAEVAVLDTTIPLTGTCDGVLTLTDAEGEYRIGIEIKTCSSSSFKEAIPYEKHIDQSIGYAALLGLSVVQLLYENKDTQELMEISVQPSPERFERIAHVCRGIYERVEVGLLPPRRPSYMECRQCAFHDLCQPYAVRRTLSSP